MRSKELHLKFDETGTEGVSMKAEFRPGSERYGIFFRSKDICLTKNAEALVSVGLLPAMKTGSALVAEGVISQKFFNALGPICEFYSALTPSLKKVHINNITSAPKGPQKENRVGTFFSAGVDSFYTLLKHQEEITDLIFIHGFDIHFADHALLKKTAERIREIGLRFGKRVIEIENNAGLFFESHLLSLYYHGAFLASVGHMLSPLFQRIYIPASFTYAEADRFLCGSHPRLDPLWSTEALEFIHDGCEATRVDKAALIGTSDVALNFLRVCFEGPNRPANCGRCEKCIRTMISLHIAGALDRCTTFENKLDTKYIATMMIYNKWIRKAINGNLKALESRTEDRKLYNALRKALRRSRWVNVLVRFPRTFKILQWIYRALKK